MLRVRRKFAIHGANLESLGHEVINPLELHKEAKTWCGYMITDIKALLTCQAIYMLSDWESSKGAKIEHDIAKRMGIRVFYQNKYAVQKNRYLQIEAV